MIDIILWIFVAVIFVATIWFAFFTYGALKKETINRIKSKPSVEKILNNSRIRFQLRGSVRLFNDLLIDEDDLKEYAKGLHDLP